MQWLKQLCSFTTKASCMVYTCLSLSQSQDGQYYSGLELILIITLAFSGSSWVLILLGEYFSDTIKQTSLTKELKNVNESRRSGSSKGD